MADTLGMNVGEGAKKLVNVKLDLENRHRSLHLAEVTRRAIDGFGHEFEYQVEIDFVFLQCQICLC